MNRQQFALQAPNPEYIIDMDMLSSDARQKVLTVLHQLQILNAKEKQQQHLLPDQNPMEQAGSILPT